MEWKKKKYCWDYKMVPFGRKMHQIPDCWGGGSILQRRYVIIISSGNPLWFNSWFNQTRWNCLQYHPGPDFSEEFSSLVAKPFCKTSSTYCHNRSCWVLTTSENLDQMRDARHLKLWHWTLQRIRSIMCCSTSKWLAACDNRTASQQMSLFVQTFNQHKAAF